MARRVFFSFHYERDNWRASQVRNSWITKPDRETAGFYDHAEWETVERQGPQAIRNWINNQMNGSSVVCVLIGSETCQRPWIRYEIQHAHEEGKAVIGVRVHQCRDIDENQCEPGETDFGLIDGEHTFEELYPVYDWVDDNGYENLGEWVEDAAMGANRPDLNPPPRRFSRPTNCRR